MHQNDNYDDEEDYDDDHNDLENKYKKYFKFDPNAWDAWGKMLYDALNEIVEYPSNVWYFGSKNIEGFPPKSLPVNSYFPNTGKGNSFQYLGKNYDGAAIWKKKYFVHDEIQSMYVDHISAHAIYFLKQPYYYKGLFDILN
jgi:hypothetical protein